ncbi:CpaF family protein [Streptomyces monticola]|uniref:CpaF family protein n=1 Tax=Streptomyces monticola TaxID=2666263 RepID=A0ABW2JTN8_9ACTN
MRGEPLYPQPVNAAARHARSVNGRPAPPAAHVGATGMVGRHPVPQVQLDYRAANEIKRQVNEQLLDEKLSGEARQQRGRALINEKVAIWADAAAHRAHGMAPVEEQALAALVFDMLFRAGRLQRYLDDDQVEDIWINGPQVFLKYGDDAQPVQVPPVADSEDELRELVRDLIRNSGQGGRTFSTYSPDVALRLPDGSRLQALGPQITGEHTFVTIRRHRIKDANLDDMVKLGTLDATSRDFLAAMVRARRNVLVAGEQSSGKTSLLRALLKEVPAGERFGTLETEFELWAHKNGFHTQVVPMEARESNGERVDGKAAGQITLLDLLYRAKRMSLTRIVVGEVRGAEITAMMQAMTSDRPGNMCTLHASHPSVVFDRIAELYLLARGNFSETLAYRQIANGLHFIVFLSVDESGPVKRRVVSHIWEITGVGEGGRPAFNEVFTPASAHDPRAVFHRPVSERTRQDLARAGFHAVPPTPNPWTQTQGVGA